MKLERSKQILSQAMESLAKQKLENIPFNPFSKFPLHRVLSQIAPHFYTERELIQIEKLSQSCCEETSHNTIEEKRVKSKKKRCPSEEFKASYGKRRVKPKKMKPNEMKMKEPKQHIKAMLPSPPPPELPINVRNKIEELNGINIRYVMCKKLFYSDLNRNNNRLSLPREKIKCDFLTDTEKNILNTKEDGRPVGLEVVVLDPEFREFNMSLKKWDMYTTSVYNLVKDWKLLLEENNWVIDNELYIWCFRVNDKLHFILNNKES